MPNRLYKPEYDHFDSFDPKLLENPPRDLSVVYSWVWNDKLDKDTIKRQLEEFADAGIYALYVIPEPPNFRPRSLKTYLEPEYMSDEFLVYYRYAVECAEKLGISLWLYDEGGWPSGGACGLTARLCANSAPLVICSREVTLDGNYSPHSGWLAFYDGDRRLTKTEISELRESGKNAGGSANSTVTGAKLTEYYVERRDHGVNFVDLTSDEVMSAFIETTHERYANTVGERFGGEISLMFTDEPKLTRQMWISDLADKYRERYGCDLLDFLPVIAGLREANDESERRVYLSYRHLLGSEFKRAFFERYADWCHEHNLGFCGHLDGDHDLAAFVGNCASSGLDMLRTMDVPGVDVIWRQIYPRDGRIVSDGYDFFSRVASSAAAQNGGNLALTETFCIYGDDISADEMRYVVNYQLLCGINVFNFMNAVYGRRRALALNMRPMICPEKPGFYNMSGYYKQLMRLCLLMRTGSRVCDTALYLPCDDIMLGGEIANSAAESFRTLGDRLEAGLVDFDIIDDEAILSAVERDGCLEIGGAHYRHIVIPDCRYMPARVREIASRYPGIGEPPLECANPCIRAVVRDTDDERICFIYNRGTSVETAEIRTKDERGCYLAAPDTGRLTYIGVGPVNIRLESGEAAVLLLSNKSYKVYGGDVSVCTLSSPKLCGVRRFKIDSDGVSSERLENLPDGEFSGEVTYEYEYMLPSEPRAGELYRLVPDISGLTLRAYSDDQLLGDCQTSPMRIEFDGSLLRRQGRIRIVAANTPAAELAANLPDAIAAWGEEEMRSYNDRLVLFEHKPEAGETAKLFEQLTTAKLSLHKVEYK